MSSLVELSRAGNFRAALRAEWTKFRTVRGWMIGLVFAALMVVLFTYLQAHGKDETFCTSPNPSSCGAGHPSVPTGRGGGAVADSYELAATPDRGRVLGAKAVVIAGVGFAVGAAASAVAIPLAERVMRASGNYIFPADRLAIVQVVVGSGALVALTAVAVLGIGTILRRSAGAILVGLIALLSLGVGTILRDSAVSTGALLGLLYLPTLIVQVVSDPWRRHLQQIAPMTAGLAIQSTRNIRSLPVSPWAGLGVLAAWAAGMLVVGLFVLKACDA